MNYKPIKKKKCVSCGAMFRPFKTTQRACSGKCALSWSRKRKQEQQDRLDLFEREDKLAKSIKSAIESTRLVVHEYIRLRDEGKPCISCGCNWNDGFQAGHYYKAELFHTLKFHFLNIHGQCYRCNNFLEGNINMYSLYLPERIGQKPFLELTKLASLDKQTRHEWDLEILKGIRQLAKIKIKQLKKNH